MLTKDVTKAIISRLSQLWQNDIFKIEIIILIAALVALLIVLIHKACVSSAKKKASRRNGSIKFRVVVDIMEMDSKNIIE